MQANRFVIVPISALIALASCSLEITGSGTADIVADDERPVDERSDDDQPDDRSDDDRDAAAPDAGDRPSKDAAPDGRAASGTCKAGMYVGRYECRPRNPQAPIWGGFGANPITGTLRFVLEESDDDTFELKEGELGASSNPFFTVQATLEGTLRCGERLQGELADARYSGFFSLDTDFTSPFTARYEAAEFVEGEWAITDSSGTQCTGIWSAELVSGS